MTTRDGIPVTTPARTLIDLADIVAPRELERAHDEADYLRLDLDGFAPIPGRRGAGRLRRLLAEHEAGSTRTRNEFEEFLFGLCRRYDLPLPRVNAVVEGHEVDFVLAAGSADRRDRRLAGARHQGGLRARPRPRRHADRRQLAPAPDHLAAPRARAAGRGGSAATLLAPE